MDQSTESKAYDVMFILDPTRMMKPNDARNSMEWMLIDIDSSLHRQICQTTALKGFAFDQEHTKHKSKVAGKKCILIHELVSTTIYTSASLFISLLPGVASSIVATAPKLRPECNFCEMGRFPRRFASRLSTGSERNEGAGLCDHRRNKPDFGPGVSAFLHSYSHTNYIF
jgi:hypothetical protein